MKSLTSFVSRLLLSLSPRFLGNGPLIATKAFPANREENRE